MPIAGLIGTGDFEVDERPKNWRDGILKRFPNGHAPLTALTSAMKKKVTDDPEFSWWEREVSNVRLQLDANLGTSAGAKGVADDPFGFGGGLQVKTNDILRVEETGELLRVTADPTVEGTITVARSVGSVAATEVLFAGDGVNPNLTIVGSLFEEGATTPNSIRYRAEKQFNYTQIFRDSLKATRTAMKTRLRTKEEVQDAKIETLLYHSIRMEYALLFGEKFEGTGANGELERMTSGILDFIPAAQKIDKLGAAVDMEELEDIFLDAFRFGSQEKVGFCGNRAMLAIQRIARRNSSLEIMPTTKEFGMDIRRVFTPQGTLVLKTHPLFNQIQSGTTGSGAYNGMDSWLLILDMADFVYRPLKESDTQYLPNRQANGVDGLTSEYLTEMGLEVHHGKHHFLVEGLRLAAADS